MTVSGTQLDGKAVLLIDDIVEDSREYTTFLLEAGARVECVKTLEAGRLSLRSQPADVLLMHLRLPDGDALKWLESDRRGEERLPCVLLSGRFDEGTYRRAYEAGAVPLPKQYVVHPEVLLAAIESAIKLALTPSSGREA
jgi:DNA-binding response OmpR family regulator